MQDLPRPGIEPVPLQWKHGVLTTGPPGKSNTALFLKVEMETTWVSNNQGLDKEINYAQLNNGILAYTAIVHATITVEKYKMIHKT